MSAIVCDLQSWLRAWLRPLAKRRHTTCIRVRLCSFCFYAVEKQVAIIYLGTQGLLREVKVTRVKEFEVHFLMEMKHKMPELLAQFKKGALPEDGLQKMVELANGLMPQYK